MWCVYIYINIYCASTYLYTIFETTLSKSCHFAAWVPGSNGPGCGLVGAEPWSIGFQDFKGCGESVSSQVK